MTIYLASDHAGFELKEKIKTRLQKNGYEVKDFGAFSYDPEDDYPDFMHPAAGAVSKCAQSGHSHPVIAIRQPAEKQSSKNLGKIAAAPSGPRNDECRGIFLGGSGQGEAMVANRYKGVRAAVLYKYDENIVKLSREHNNANVLCLGVRFLTEEETLKSVELWLKTPFSGEERHKRRIAKF